MADDDWYRSADAGPEADIGAHERLGALHEQRGDAAAAIDAYRTVIRLEAGGNVRYGAELSLARVIAAEGVVEAFDEADRLLDAAADDPTAVFFGRQMYDYALARARIAAARGQRDFAAAYALGAASVAPADDPPLPRHRPFGLFGLRPAKGDWRELERYVRRGDAEAAAPVIDRYRSLDGEVQWGWGLIEKLHRPPELESASVPDLDPTTGEPRAAKTEREVVDQLRAAGIDLVELRMWSLKALKSMAEVKIATPALLCALEDPPDDELHWNLLTALQDRRARRQAALPVIGWFRECALGGRTFTNSYGNLLMSFARDEHLDLLEPIVRDPAFGGARGYVFWALAYMKSERAVALAIECVDDDDLRINALRALSDMKSELGESTLRRSAEQEPIPLTRKQTQYRRRNEQPDAFVRQAETTNLEIEVARSGLEKLARARASGKSRHAL